MLGSPDSALVILSPGDSLDTAIDQVRQAEADQISLLVADGNRALQSISACEKLRQAANKATKSVTIYSSDEKTCDAAQLCKLPVVRIESSVPSPSREQRPTSLSSAPATRQGSPDDFFAALDQVPESSPGPRGLREIDQREHEIFRDDIDEEWASVLDEFSQVPIGEQQGSNRDDEWTFDNLSESVGSQQARAEDRERSEAGADDDELEYVDEQHQPQHRASPVAALAAIFGGLLHRRGRHSSYTAADQLELEPAEPIGLARPELSDQEQEERERERRKLNLIPIASLLLGLVLVGVVLMFSSSTPSFTLFVAPPAETSTRMVENIAIPFEALQAQARSETVSYEHPGQVLNETLTPVSSARGTVQLANRLAQPIQLVKGQSVVIGTNPQGQQVRYYVDADVTIPAATQSFTGYTFGYAEAPIVAVSGGPAYNLPAESKLNIENLGDSVLVRNPTPISGGEEQPLKVVTQADVDRLLGEALPQLANRGQAQLQTLAEQSGMAITGGTYTPTIDVLAADPGSYEVSTIPPLGQPSEDGSFTLVVSAQFSALLVPNSVDVNQVVRERVEDYLRQTGSANLEKEEIGPINVSFNPQHLTATVELTPKGGSLSEDDRLAIAAAVAGKPREVAVQALDRLVERGLISSYNLPPDTGEYLPAVGEIKVEERRP